MSTTTNNQNPKNMKAAQIALRRHAPSVAVLGTAALAALSTVSSSSNDDDANSRVNEAASYSVEALISVRADTDNIHQVHKPTTADAVSRIFQSPKILATSDASAERSVSVAAAARLSPKKPIVEATTNSSSLNTGTDNNGTGGGNKHGSTKNNSKRPIDRQEKGDDSYPTFTPYHHSLLKEYLTPDVWKKLSNRKTSFGTTIEDIIRAGVSLPIGASPPRRVGVLVADAECYTVFKELLEPIISHYHGIQSYEEWMDPELPMESHFKANSDEDGTRDRDTAAARSTASKSSNLSSATTNDDYGIIKSGAGYANDDFLLDDEEEDVLYTTDVSSSSSSAARSSSSRQQKANLRRHCTIINNPNLVRRKADPEGKYILSTRIRVARSLDGVRFPATMSRSERRKVERLIHDCTNNFQAPNLSKGVYLPVLSMTNDQNLDLIERHILFDNPNEWTIASGLGRDWPDGRAIFANVSDIQNQTPDFMIWINEEDHLRIMTLKKGGDIQGAFTSLMNGVRELERELQIRGWHFAKDPRLGYLVSCPTNVGTTM
jgi:hypothetical protein